MHEGNPVLNIQFGGNGASTARLYIYLLNVPSFFSRYFIKIKRTSRLGRLLALLLKILSNRYSKRYSNKDCLLLIILCARFICIKTSDRDIL